jgi:large subunit ribosomal protein L30
MATKAQAKKSEGGKTITVVQTGSSYGKKPGMRETLIGLGLGRTHKQRELQDTPAVRGMLWKVRHLVRVEEKGN